MLLIISDATFISVLQSFIGSVETFLVYTALFIDIPVHRQPPPPQPVAVVKPLRVRCLVVKLMRNAPTPLHSVDSFGLPFTSTSPHPSFSSLCAALQSTNTTHLKRSERLSRGESPVLPCCLGTYCPYSSAWGIPDKSR
uniref:Uncharacterized protein n=1 Tax=Trypanosoma vivax (strain Y486) TaxID=1055687 RepID=G0TZH7_TRYVY|nr:hypothetical protein TVY486_0706900 [Trypanosoma vivax Y486]